MKKIIHLFFLICISSISGQVGINNSNPDKNAMLDIKSNNKGLLVPRVSLKGASDVVSVSNPANSLLVYNLTNGNNGTPLDTTDDVIANSFYYYSNKKWNRFLNQDYLNSALTTLNLNRIILLVKMKPSGNDNSFVSNDLGNNIRRFIFDDIVTDKQSTYNTTTGEFTAPLTGYYLVSINTLLKPWRSSNDSTKRNLHLGVSKPYLGAFSTSGLTDAVFLTESNSIDPALGPNFITYQSFKTVIYLTAGQKTVPLTKNVTPGSTQNSYEYNLNVELSSYDRTISNSMSIIFLPSAK